MSEEPIYSMLTGKNPCLGLSCSFTDENGPDANYVSCVGQYAVQAQYAIHEGQCWMYQYLLVCTNGTVVNGFNPGTGTITQDSSPYWIDFVNPCEHSECSSLC